MKFVCYYSFLPYSKTMSQCPFSPELEFDNSNQKTRGQPLVDLLQSPLSESSTQSILKPSSKENIISFTPPSNRSLKVSIILYLCIMHYTAAKVGTQFFQNFIAWGRGRAGVGKEDGRGSLVA